MKPGFVVPVREKIAFGLGDFAINIVFTTIGFYSLFFLVNVAGLPPQWAGIILFIGRAWSALFGYGMGMISDRTETRFGRRRPYILFGCVPFGIAFFLMWIVPFDSATHLLIYYLVISFIFFTLFSLVSIPYGSLMPELSQNYDERTSISGYRMGLSFVGNLVAAAGVSVIVDVLFSGKDHYTKSYPVMGAAFGLIVIISLLVTFIGTHERVKSEKAITGGLLDTFASIVKLREFRIVFGMFVFNMIGFDLLQTILIFFVKDVLHISENMTFVVMGIPLVVAVAAAPVWVILGEKLGKRKAYIISALYFAVSLLTCLVAPVGDLSFVLMIGVLAGIGVSASQIIPWSIVPDVIEFDEYQHGVRREGAFIGIIILLYAISSSAVIALASVMLGYFGYAENSTAPQPDSALTAIRWMIGIGPGIFFLISTWFVKILPITKERFDEIRRIIEERKRKA